LIAVVNETAPDTCFFATAASLAALLTGQTLAAIIGAAGLAVAAAVVL